MVDCQHVDMTLVRTEGLGGWQPVEVYRCDVCSAEILAPIEIDDEDD